MTLFIFILLVLVFILQISILSTCSDINDNILDIERSIRQLPRHFMRSIYRKGKK